MITLFAEAPALPLHTAGKYVAAAYIVFALVLLIYVWIMARRLISSQRELLDLRRQLDARESVEAPASPHPLDDENDNDSDSHYRLGADEKGMTADGAEFS